MLVYSVGRGVIEFWRGDTGRGLWLGEILSTSQLLGLAGAVLAAAMLVRGRLQVRRCSLRPRETATHAG